LAAVSYEYPWSDWVVSLKFREHTARAHTLATLMRNAPWFEPALDAADVLIPMPLSAQRLAERGFNQTLLLANALCRSKVQSGLLLRIKDTPPQSSLPRIDRLSSVKNAYAVDPLKRNALQDKRVVLVDDVMTSGASLDAAAIALRQAGAAHITGLVFARAES
jgi:ComF family protein